jgi:hypothetical protein
MCGENSSCTFSFELYLDILNKAVNDAIAFTRTSHC